jgi:hypothetical protein
MWTDFREILLFVALCLDTDFREILLFEALCLNLFDHIKVLLQSDKKITLYINLLKPIGIFTYHQVYDSKILHCACFALSDL